MKKILALMLAVVLVGLAGLAGCNGIDSSGMKTYKSKNGFSVNYPDGFNMTFDFEQGEGGSLDFMMIDQESNSSVSIITTTNNGQYDNATKESYEENFGYPLTSFENLVINEMPAVRVSYKVGFETITTQYINGDKIHTVIYVEGAETPEEIRRQFKAVTGALKKTQ